MPISGIPRYFTNRLSCAAFPSIPFNRNQGRITTHFRNPSEKLLGPFPPQHKMWTTPLSLPITRKSFEDKRVDLMDRQVFASAHDEGSLTGLGLKTAAFVLLIKGLSDVVLAEEELGRPSEWHAHDERGLLEVQRGGAEEQLKARQKEFDSALETIWPTIWPTIVKEIRWPWSMFVSKCANAAEMRRWLNHPTGKKAVGSISHLDLRSFSLRVLPPEIKEFKGLTFLDLSNNNLSDLEVLCHLSQLETLIVKDNNVAEIPKSIDKLTRLKTLKLGFNRLETIPKTIGSLTQLERLILDHNLLKSLPKTIGELSSLTELSLRYNHLGQIPEEFAKLSQLKKLYLGGNELTGFPDAICKLTSLEYLSLRDNKLAKLPAAISDLRSLITLDLSGNKLTTLPDEMATLDRLGSLNVRRNPLTGIPAKIQAMLSLKYLFFSEGLKLDTQLTERSI